MTHSTRGDLPEQILFVSHTARQCGVHEYGLNITDVLQSCAQYSFVYAECSTPQELLATVESVRPAAIIYNYYPTTLPWFNKELLGTLNVPHLGIMHEVTQQNADRADTSLFDYHIAPDPTLVMTNRIVFKTGRVIPSYTNRFDLPAVTTIGSFGFATAGKGFEQLVSAVQEEFDQAIIRLHIPAGDFADSDCQELVRRCQGLIVKDGITLVASHDFLEKGRLLDFLAQNTLNAFFYEKHEGRGISSTVEHALAVRRPIALTRSTMFRHVLTGPAESSICVEANAEAGLPAASLRQIIDNGIEPLLPFYSDWDGPHLVRDYERILHHVLEAKAEESASAPGCQASHSRE